MAPDTPLAARSRLLILTAVATAIVYGGGMVALGTPPGADDTGAQVAAWFTGHRAGVRWFVWTATAAMPLAALMFALMRRLLPAPHRDVFSLGAATIIVTTAIQAWIWGGLALHTEHLDDATARALLDVALFWGPVLTGATITVITPVALLALQGRVGLPGWLGWFGMVVVVEQALETVTIFGTTGFTAPGGPMNVQLGESLVWAWLLGFAACGSLGRHSR